MTKTYSEILISDQDITAVDSSTTVATYTYSKEHSVEMDQNYRQQCNIAYNKLAKFTSFKRNWDLSNGEKINDECLDNAKRILKHMIFLSLPVPTPVPLNNGMVQFEWHNENKHLEIEFINPFQIDIFYLDEDSSKPRTWSQSISSSFEYIYMYVNKMN
ncbi:MAG TPA: hypothetical protein VGB30_05200 [bacterium]|jgi:hypothetical protein